MGQWSWCGFLILCVFVVFAVRCFMFGLTLLLVLVIFRSCLALRSHRFGRRASLCASRAFVFVLHAFLFVFFLPLDVRVVRL